MLLRGGQPGRAMRRLPRLVQALRAGGHHAQADALQAAADQRLSGLRPEPRRFARSPARRGEIPAGCASCGGPLHPDEVEWHAANTAECPYCGSPVKASPPGM
jgi:hypothetical protein